MEVLQVEKRAEANTKKQRRHYDTNNDLGFSNAFRALPARKQYFAQ
jgi:hypothetical protein